MNKILLTSLLAMSLSATPALADHFTLPSGSATEKVVALSTIDLKNATNGNNNMPIQLNKSVRGGTLSIAGDTFDSGLGVHAPGKIVVRLNEGVRRFKATIGVDDGADNKPNHGIVGYNVVLVKQDGTRQVKATGVMKRGDKGQAIDVDLTGGKFLILETTLGNNNDWADHFDWANAHFLCAPNAQQPEVIPEAAMSATHFVKLPVSQESGTEYISLSSMDLKNVTNGWGTIRPNKSIGNNPLVIDDTTYESGVGVHAKSRIVVKLNGAVSHFRAMAGVDAETNQDASDRSAIVGYRVILRGEDGREKVELEGTARRHEQAVNVDVALEGWKYLILEVNEGNGVDWADHFDWANAYFVYREQNSTRPVIVSEAELTPSLACATELFSLPNTRFLHKIVPSAPSSTVSVTDLPEGLYWNAHRHTVEGKLSTEGRYNYKILVTTDGNTQTFPASVTVSNQLVQPKPMMGWISWNVVQDKISTQVVKTVADNMVKLGLRDAGYNFIIIDDLWHAPQRNSDGTPKEDPAKFPIGMGATVKYVHDQGLKFGIYSDAAPKTCAGAYGSYGYENIDAKQYAKWGVDLLKYDYCGAPGDAVSAQQRYKAMGDALKASGRDILFYMCEWGVREPWKWGSTTGATTWRATYDTRDCWQGKSGGIGVTQSIAAMKDLWAYSGVNRFNDADMMCVAIHGTGKSSSDLCLTGPGMTQDEYRTQFALWCMWSSPLTLSFDLTKPLSADDKAIITNADLIAIDQDAMGQQAEFVGQEGNIYYFMKDLENGDVAISATNVGPTQQQVKFDFSKFSALSIKGHYLARDCQAQKTLENEVETGFTTTVRSHATAVFRLTLKGTGVAQARTSASAQSNTLYDLSGRHANGAASHGVYIRDGKRVALP